MGEGNGEGNGTTTRTIRVEKDVDELLRRLSGEERVSVNHLVNRALRQLVEWDAYAQKFGVVSMPAALVQRMMGELDEEQAIRLGTWAGQNMVREFLTFWFKEPTLEHAVHDFPRLSAQYGHAYEYEERLDGGRCTIILKHGQGQKWSAFYAEMLRALFEQVDQRDAAIEATENQVVARFARA